MMRLLKICLKGFRTFRERQEIELPQEPGLYLMRGINEVDEALEGNDVGKSTLWSAVYWCLFGVTERGLRAGSVVSWGEEQAWVGLELEVGGRVRCVWRQQNPNELRIDGDLTIQDRVDELIGRNGTEFLHSVLIGQFSEYFLDLGPSDKLALFSESLGLDYWEERADKAKADVDTYAAAAALLTNQIEREKGKIEAMRLHRKSARENSERWEEENEQRRLGLETEYAKLREKKRGLVFVLEEADRQQAILEGELKSARWKDERCKYCGSVISRDRERWETKQRKEIYAVTSDISDARVELAKIKASLRQIRERLAEEDSNPHKAALEALQCDLTRSKARKRFLVAKRDLAASSEARALYWVNGFRDLRLWIMDSTLSELEMHCNSGLIQLGLERWRIRLDVERDNKSGGVTRGFNVAINSGESGEYAPWKGWGGGATQRLRLAAQMGIAG